MNGKIIAVVVTYNRKELLMECLTALLYQTTPVDQVILIDNASTDGTGEMLRTSGLMQAMNFDYRLMTRNLGGAGGFYEGLKIAREKKADWIWIMDDDTIPQPDSLKRMVEKIDRYPHASFFASCVAGPNGEPMNVTNVDIRGTSNGYSDWYFQLNERMVKIRAATFVSILINARGIDACGLPCKDFFLWADDTEYTTRLTGNFGPAFLVGDSWVCHKRYNAVSLDIRKETDWKRIKNYHYAYRNGLIVKALYDGPIRASLLFAKEQISAFKLLFSGRDGIRKSMIIEKGLLNFILQYRRFKRIIELEIKTGAK